MSTYLGQNFLTDSKIKYWIANKVKQMYEELGTENLIEIWPGKWAITKLIKDISQNFLIFEKDTTFKEKLSEVLSENTNYQIVWGDVLEADLEQLLWMNTLVVGNLPYYITSPILRKFFTSSFTKSPLGGLFMVQEEVGEKIRFDAKKKSYLYWLLNYEYEVQYLKTVPAKAFTPAPKIKSCLIWLKKKSEVPALSFERLLAFLDDVSPYSRKTLGKICKMLEKKEKYYPISESLMKKRLEELDWKDLEEILLV